MFNRIEGAGVTYTQHLVLRARNHWVKSEPLPLDLFAEMLRAGLDVSALESNFQSQE